MSTQVGSDTTVALMNPDDLIVELPILVLNVHSRCNCRCVMCDIWKREENTELSLHALENHRASLRRLHVRWVILSGGEPLFHRDLHALCTFFRALDIRLTLLTTGLLLSRRASEVAELFDEIIVSMDGPPRVHDAIRRVNGAFNLISSGIAAVRRYRPDMRITGRLTVQRVNHCHLQESVAAARAIGLDSLSFLAVDTTSEAFNRSLVWPTERQSQVSLTASELTALEAEIEELITNCSEDIQSGYIAESAEKLRRIVTHFAAHLGFTDPVAPKCNAPWVSAVVEFDGSVRPCFFHPSFGNIHHSDIEEIVNGENALNFRRSLSIPTNPVCRRCVCSLNYPRQDGSAE